MHRFYSPTSDFSSKKTVLTDRCEIHHLKNVLRLKKGQTISVFNNEGQEATGRISLITPSRVEIDIESVISSGFNKNTHLILACAVPKKTKFETIIEKCTELGVDEIIPLKTKRTELSLTEPQRLDKKLERYKTVAINASKQSRRLSIPIIHPLTSFDSAIKYADEQEAIKIIPSLMGERQTLFNCLQSLKYTKNIIFFIGPEGDFTEKEYRTAKTNNCIPVSLGKTILKVETAAISVICFSNLYFDQI